MQFVVLASLVTVGTAAQWTCRDLSVTDSSCTCSHVSKGVTLHCSSGSATIVEGVLGTKVNVSCVNNPPLTLPHLDVGHVQELALQDCPAAGVTDLLGVTRVKYLVFGSKSHNLSGTQLANLTGVDSVILKGLGVTHIHSDMFGGSPIEEMDLRHNELTELEEGVFSGLRRLRGLFMSYNQLTTLPDGLFLHNVELVGLHLDNNHLNHISSKLLEPLRHLQILSLANNRLTSVSEGGGGEVWRLPALRGLYLANNQLVNPDHRVQSVLKECLTLVNINVANNNLTQLYHDWTRLPKLRELRLSRNNLPSLQVEELDFQSANIVVHLDHNNITEATFNRSVLQEECHPSAAVIVYMHGNPFRCDCAIEPLVRLPKGSGSSVYMDIPRPDRRVVFKGTNKMICASPQSMQSRPLMDIPVHGFSCPLGS